ncbi:MAG: hypothetical protein KGH89_09285, partial [Thaumarchaeota archaeon]|nr:hypothetical protein [Nitrososphaerota archaeon]
FFKGIQYLVQQGLITLPPTQTSTSSSQAIPSWVKNNAKWWSEGQVSDSEFIQSIQYLVQNGIIVVQTNSQNSLVSTTTPTSGYTLYKNDQYGFSFEYPKGWGIIEHFGQNSTIKGVDVFPDNSLWVGMGVIKNDNYYANKTNAQILNGLSNTIRSFCSLANSEQKGFTCANTMIHT